MLNDIRGIRHFYIAPGRTDLRKGQDSLLALITNQFGVDPFDEKSIFLFCGTRKNQIKAVVFEGDGFVVASKKILNGHYQWPDSPEEVLGLSRKQFLSLMSGFAIEYESTIKKSSPKYV